MFRTALILVALATLAPAQEKLPPGSLNKPDRLEWFRDLGFGMFIHWSVDSQTGVVISHSLVGADEAYTNRFFHDLPMTFNPRKFYPQDWAALAKLAGIRYVVFTAKHHSGFAMWDTKTTDFGIMHTPFQRDVTREILDAFRAQGIRPGLYFSPDDFSWLWRNKVEIQRNIPDVQPRNNPGLMQLDLVQVRELMTGYGPIDVVFFDGEPYQLRDLAWRLQPDTIVTRGAIQTPELYVPGIPLEGPWEANFTMGTAWQYQPQNELYKTGGQLIDILIETRAKGGNLLLNIGPKPDGEIAIEQESRLREIALWNLVNGEALKSVRPWVITNENNIWFTRHKDSSTVYAFLTKMSPWKLGEPKTFTLRSVRATPMTQVTVLGQSDEIVEYRPDVKPKTTWKQTESGLDITAYRAQRLYTDRRWPNPVELKGSTATLHARLNNLGNVDKVEVGFQYREKKGGTDLSEKTEPWTDLAGVGRTSTGDFVYELGGLERNRAYEYRARVRHPLITTYGEEKTFRTQ